MMNRPYNTFKDIVVDNFLLGIFLDNITDRFLEAVKMRTAEVRITYVNKRLKRITVILRKIQCHIRKRIAKSKNRIVIRILRNQFYKTFLGIKFRFLAVDNHMNMQFRTKILYILQFSFQSRKIQIRTVGKDSSVRYP